MADSSTMQGSKKQVQCTYCDGTTHTIERCFYLIGFSSGHALHGKNVQPRNRADKAYANQTGIESLHTNIKSMQTPNQSPQFTPEELTQIKVFFQAGKTTICANYTGNPPPFCSSSTTQNFEDPQLIINNGATNHIATSVIDEVTLPNGSYARITSPLVLPSSPTEIPSSDPTTPIPSSPSKDASSPPYNPMQSSASPHPNTPTPILRRSKRPQQTSVLLRDFHCDQVSMSPLSASPTKSASSQSGTQYPLSSFISY
ncbi:hypothetical protein DKX38_001327 [Salix brachista]|uniref:Uncharacterized protein n=1 Tax=Salix brachista TaxID=2182728 RepID=A0A5N5P5C9_9ROSI|nr:hypothetical protein DKX38_001327 [Salix brachista]